MTDLIATAEQETPDKDKHYKTTPASLPAAAPKFTRCRTGCLRCRKRRRKCDERKPRCRNCIDKNLDCSYGMQVTFLPKNSITVAEEEMPSVSRLEGSDGDCGVRRGSMYGKIQFVNEDPLSIENLVESADDSLTNLSAPPSPAAREPVAGLRTEQRAVSSTVNRSDDARHHIERDSEKIYAESNPRATFAPWDLDSHRPLHPPKPEPPAALEPPIAPNTFNENDEFAVRGLLALGTQPGLDGGSVPGPVDHVDIGPDYGFGIGGGEGRSGTPLVSPTNQSIVGGWNRNPPFADGIHDMPVSTPTTHSFSGFGIKSLKQSEGFNTESTSTDEGWKMKLFQYYRYNVAPWLDIIDLNHSFGILALQMSVESSSGHLLTALLALSEACMAVQKGHVYVHEHGVRAFDCGRAVEPYLESPGSGMDPTETALLHCFQELKNLVSDVSKTWVKEQTAPRHEYSLIVSLAERAFGLDLDSAVYWMFLRVDLGNSLANNSPLHIPLPSHPIQISALLSRTESTPERVGHYAQVLLWLCGKALSIYHQDSAQPGPESWLQTFEELSRWHYLRPQEFQPMVELGKDCDRGLTAGSEFPMLLFTNGAGALCNQLYHTAMLFMLDCKPRTAGALLDPNQSQKDYPHYSRVLSPLWHAQRICGIALNNDRAECWDPCLLASFLVAARYMTHESQQVEIVRGFDRIQSLTGWSVGDYLSQLREEWSFLDGE